MSLKLERKIGLAEGIGIVTGGVIGMGVYSLIPSIAREAGHSAWLAISIALTISVIGVLPLIQIASAMPVAGGGYMYCSRLLHPLVGTIVSFLAIVGGGSSVCVVSIGLGEFVKPYLGMDISLHVLAMIMLSGFYFLYQFGIKLVTWLQLVMSIQLILSLIAYTIGISYFTEVTYEFSIPAQSGGLIMGIILALNVCLGFQIITELGEEIKDARKNIPLSLFLGGLVILVIYITVSFAYIHVAGGAGEAFHQKDAALLETARIYLPRGLVIFTLLGAVSAGLTSLNAGAIALPRELYSQARDNIIPSYFSVVNPRTKTPLRSVTAFFVIVFLILCLGQALDSAGILATFFKKSIDFYAFMAVCGIMFLTVFVSVAAFRLPGQYPELYKNAYLKIPRPLLIAAIIISIITSIGLILIIFMESFMVMWTYLILLFGVILYYLLRKSYLEKRNEKMGNIFDPFS